MTITTALVCATFVANTGDADAADWNGAYLGLHGVWTDSEPDFDNDSGLEPATDYDFGAEGYGIGVFAGRDWQDDVFVWGLAGDVDYLGLPVEERESVRFLGKGDVDVYDYDLDWTASARLRGGMLFADEALLVYGTAGVAVTSANATSSKSPSPNGAVTDSAALNDLLAGAVFGGGVEYRVAPNWTLKGEYLRYEFEPIDVGGDATSTTAVRFVPGLEQVRFGIAYRF
ncbi:outer membrane protein [Oricola sp.]|uniref:outer membrane protein n=1 Tax=Oricola sp. TaxID=1979950 RepID=UPI003BA87CF3